MRAYIDESGDEGTGGRGTRWLTFGCVVVRDANKPKLVIAIKAAGIHLGEKKPRLIHFKKMTHLDKCGVYDRLTSEHVPWKGIIVASDTTKLLDESWLDRPEYQYNYALRYVIERVSRYAERIGEEATIYIEDRRNFHLQAFRDYLWKLRARDTDTINWELVDPLRVYVAKRKERAGLCLADGLAHASFRALQPDAKWGLCELGYLNAVAPRLWRGPPNDHNIFIHGFVLMPTPAWSEFAEEYSWLETLRNNARLR